jgi:hypothetical protein
MRRPNPESAGDARHSRGARMRGPRGARHVLAMARPNPGRELLAHKEMIA